MMALAADDTDDTTSDAANNTTSDTEDAAAGENGEDANSSETLAPMTGTTAQGSIVDGKNTAKINFATFHYTQDDIGTHEYAITENTPEGTAKDPNITYASETIVVKVEVKDAGNGTLTAKIVDQPEGGVKFTNKYKATGSITLAATKELDGRTKPIQAEEFEFVVKENGTEVASGKTLAGTAGGTTEAPVSTASVEFETIKYTQDNVGTHTYEISEKTGTNGTIQYIAQPVEVTVVVTDNADGTLTATATYPTGGAVFVNTYDTEAKVKLAGQKKFYSNRAEDVQKDEFTFTVDEVDADGKTITNGANVASGSTEIGGNIKFSSIKYKVADIGTHYYKVSEVVPADTDKDPTIGYTAEPQIVTVVISQDEDGTNRFDDLMRSALVPVEN
jgi:pilin isopeptide linkage protein